MIISVENLSKRFQKNLVLDNINMKLESGNIYGFIGRNGSGKSVLLKIICGLYEPSEGKVFFDDVDIFKENKIPPNTRALIEKPDFIPDLTGKENLELLVEIQNLVGDKEIEETLENVGLLADKDKSYGKYSLGMKQKLGIAQVLVEDPQVMIFDEPFNGIEDYTANKIRDLLLKKKNDGKLIIIASHIKEDIENLANIVYKFDDGKIKQIK